MFVHVPRIFLFLLSQRDLAVETEHGVGFREVWSDPDAGVENETFSLVMGAALLLKIFQNAAIELEDFLKPPLFEEWAGFFAPDPAGAEDDHGFLFGLSRQPFDGVGKLAE